MKTASTIGTYASKSALPPVLGEMFLEHTLRQNVRLNETAAGTVTEIETRDLNEIWQTLLEVANIRSGKVLGIDDTHRRKQLARQYRIPGKNETNKK